MQPFCLRPVLLANRVDLNAVIRRPGMGRLIKPATCWLVTFRFGRSFNC